jgi:(2Fe-2S) ferredoxin
MEATTTKLNAHLFICCREREGNKACCSKKGAESLFEELKSWVKSEGLKAKIKVSKSSCLGHCEEGITACLYPQNQWFTHIKKDNLEDLQKMLTKYAE